MTTVAAAGDVRRLLTQEQRDLVTLLRGLSEEEWEAPSLCAGWRVRDVVGHLVGATIGFPAYLAIAIRAGSADRVNAQLVSRAKAQSTSSLLNKLEASIGRGWATTLLPSVTLADTVVHHQDIRRPLGRERTIPSDRLVAVLKHPDPFAHPRRRSRGLRLVATDVDWSKGDGPEVRGTGEAIALAVAGRGVALHELHGEGVALLRQRVTQS